MLYFDYYNNIALLDKHIEYRTWLGVELWEIRKAINLLKGNTQGYDEHNKYINNLDKDVMCSWNTLRKEQEYDLTSLSSKMNITSYYIRGIDDGKISAKFISSKENLECFVCPSEFVRWAKKQNEYIDVYLDFFFTYGYWKEKLKKERITFQELSYLISLNYCPIPLETKDPFADERTRANAEFLIHKFNFESNGEAIDLLNMVEEGVELPKSIKSEVIQFLKEKKDFNNNRKIKLNSQYKIRKRLSSLGMNWTERLYAQKVFILEYLSYSEVASLSLGGEITYNPNKNEDAREEDINDYNLVKLCLERTVDIKYNFVRFREEKDGVITGKISPKELIAWAIDKDIHLPNEFISAAIKMGIYKESELTILHKKKRSSLYVKKVINTSGIGPSNKKKEVRNLAIKLYEDGKGIVNEREMFNEIKIACAWKYGGRGFSDKQLRVDLRDLTPPIILDKQVGRPKK